MILSIDGVGAFDHVSRARMFEQLLSNTQLHAFAPFVRQWYDTVSGFHWTDDNGQAHTTLQADGGEQGNALMPALFCLALPPAMVQISEAWPEGASAAPYLDDIYIFCEREDVVNLLGSVQEILSRVCHIDVSIGKLAA